MKRGFTLVELLVVIAILAALMAVGLPVMKQARERANEAACMSNLRQMEMILKAYTSDHDGLFPNPTHFYHSFQSRIEHPWSTRHSRACRWHDALMSLNSPTLTRDHPELKGNLAPYLEDLRILLCKTGARANREQGCRGRQHLADPSDQGDPNAPIIPIVPQYTYTMNAYLYATFQAGATGIQANGPLGDAGLRTVREVQVRRESQVTRSPSEVFAFGEQNSWYINTTDRSGAYREPKRPAAYNLNGRNLSVDHHLAIFCGVISLSSLNILPSHVLGDSIVVNHRLTFARMSTTDPVFAGDAFATCHRPRGGDLNTGHSYASMLDGHVEKITVADQLRASRRDPNLPPSRFGPGGNLRLAWPSEIPPLCGWESQ